jgi:hypothetical protein
MATGAHQEHETSLSKGCPDAHCWLIVPGREKDLDSSLEDAEPYRKQETEGASFPH